MPTFSYSQVIRDITWSDIGGALDAVQSLDNDNNIDLHARYDTSGGELEDGTTYQTEAVLDATYHYQLGDGATALDDFAGKLSQVPPLPDDKAQLKDTIKQRG